MLMTERVRELIEMNTTNHYIPFVVVAENPRIFPLYFARIIEGSTIAMPVTGATGLDEALKETSRAVALVADRAGGYEAYVLEGTARYVTNEMDYQLVAAMRNMVPGFPIHGAVVFEVESVHLAPPP